MESGTGTNQRKQSSDRNIKERRLIKSTINLSDKDASRHNLQCFSLTNGVLEGYKWGPGASKLGAGGKVIHGNFGEITDLLRDISYLPSPK